MRKIFRLLAVCTIAVPFATASIAWAQTYTTVDYPGADDSSLNGGPNPQGAAVGSYDAPGVSHGGFVYYRGRFTPVNVPWAGPDGTIPFAINPEGAVVGGYLDQSDVEHGFLFYNGQYTTVDYPGAAQTEIDGINPSGEMVGTICVDVDCNDARVFVRSNTGQFTSFLPSGATGIFSGPNNPAGASVGAFFNATGEHGYLLYRGVFTAIDFPGPGNHNTACGGINPQGDIVGWYRDGNNVRHAYLLHNAVFTSFDFPGATSTSAQGINAGGTMVGAYSDAGGHVHGFVRTPYRRR